MEKNIYIGLILVSIFILIASFFSKNQILETHLTTQQVFLSKIEWQVSGNYKKGETQSLELSFKDFGMPLKITNEDFEKLKRADFKADILENDTLTIKYDNGLIYFLSKNGKEYTAFDEANEQRTRFSKILRLAAGLCLLVCMVLLKFRT